MNRLKFASFVVLAVLLLFACSKEPPLQKDCDALQISKYAHLGDYHNAALSNVYENFIPLNTPGLTYAQKIDIIKSFNQAFVLELGLEDSDVIAIQNELEAYKNLVDKYVAYDKFFVQTDIGYANLYEALEDALQLEIIDEFEFGLLNYLLGLIEANHNGSLSMEELAAQLNVLQNNWNAQGYTVCDNYGEFSAMVLAISIASVDWWLNHPDAGDIGTRVAPWVAADVGGAIYGTVAGAVGSKLINGEVSWKATGWAALAGAVGASTGIAGKIGKWLFG